jgi:GWxTD domain-containing protein
MKSPFGEEGIIMRRQRLIFLVCCALALILAPIAEAQLSGEYADWAEGPEGFLLTKKEKKEWGKISTDAEAERFIALFWARRDPDPNNPFNPFRAEFEAKVRFADENFGHGNRRGALSERGRVLILMGRPDSRQVRGPDGPPAIGAASGETGAVENNTETWYYNPANLPAGFKAKGAQLYFFFYEERLDSNFFELDRTSRESYKAMSALSRAPEVYLLHPDLTEIPKPVSVAGGAPASAEHLAWLDGSEAPFDDITIVISELGVQDSVNRPLWVHLELPPDAPELDLLVGRVKESGGEVVSNFEIAATPLPGQYGASYHLTFPLAEGSYTLDVVGSAAGRPQLVQSIAADISSVPDAGTWMSPVWLGTGVTPNPEATLGSAFTVGGWHLAPISGPELTRAAEIAYFGFVVRPQLNDEGAVELVSRIHLKRDGKELSRPLEVPLGSSQILGDLYMYGNSIGLEALPETGPYEFVFEVIETNSETTTERLVAIEITE